MATHKQRKLIKGIVENLGNPKGTKTMGELMLDAGYSEVQSKNPQQIFNSPVIKEGTADFIKSLNDKRKMALTYITKAKLKKAPARENAYILDILTKNHQLLSGGNTETNEMTIKWK